MRMHPVFQTITPDEAWALSGSGYFESWLASHGLEYSRQLASDLMDRACEASPPPRDDPRRTDGAELREFVERAARLPPRLRDIASLCLDQGLSLTACAARLSISRETVRVHLRRLRALQRRAAARAAARAAVTIS
jgi:DNA-directed RNA polymerase specialized sigma24 family protein